METKKIIAVIVVIVVIAAVVAVAVVYSGDDDDDTVTASLDGRLMIYGNANMDDYLNEDDITYIEAIINGEADETELADANQDGSIDEQDIEYVQMMIDHTPMVVYYYNSLAGGATAVNYPVTNVVTVTAEVCLANKIMGNTANMVGYNGSLDSVLFSDIREDAVQFSSSGEIPIETLSELDVDAVVALPTSSYVTNEDEITSNGIDIIRLGFRDSDPTSAYITYAFLIGDEERGTSYAQFVDETLAYIEEVVSESVDDDDRVTGMVLGYNVIYGTISDYGNVIEMAGGTNAVDWYEHRYVSDGMEWLYEYDFDYIVGRVTAGGYDYSEDPEGYDDVLTVWNNYQSTYALTEAVSNGNLVLINTSVPTVINAAYLAAIFYPDLFGEDFGDTIHQQYIEQFIDNLAESDYDVSDGLFAITTDTIV